MKKYVYVFVIGLWAPFCVSAQEVIQKVNNPLNEPTGDYRYFEQRQNKSSETPLNTIDVFLYMPMFDSEHWGYEGRVRFDCGQKQEYETRFQVMGASYSFRVNKSYFQIGTCVGAYVKRMEKDTNNTHFNHAAVYSPWLRARPMKRLNIFAIADIQAFYSIAPVGNVLRAEATWSLITKEKPQSLEVQIGITMDRGYISPIAKVYVWQLYFFGTSQFSLETRKYQGAAIGIAAWSR